MLIFRTNAKSVLRNEIGFLAKVWKVKSGLMYVFTNLLDRLTHSFTRNFFLINMHTRK